MAYLDESEDILLDIYSRKEFYRFKPDESKKDGPFDNLTAITDVDKYERHVLKPRSYQMLPATFISPHTPYRRGFIKYGTGIGKTMTSLIVAQNIIKMFMRSGQDDRNVFIIGFSKKIYQNELLTHPEFGFASEKEIREYKKLQHMVIHGTDQEKRLLGEMKIRLFKRLSNKRLGGYFKFFGYREFANHLFIVPEDFDIYKADETEIKQAIADGRVKINHEIMSQFEHGVLICDEIHNTYNSLEKNNWGMAIQTVIDHVPTLRALYLSATPFNASQTEIIDLANLLSDKKLMRSEIFDDAGNLRKGAEGLIKQIMAGKVFFMHDSDNSSDYPEVIWKGDKIPGIDYLMFHRCKLSAEHAATYRHEFAQRGQTDEESQTLMQDKQYLLDFSLPNPDPKSKYGIYKTSEVLYKLRAADDSWKKKHRIRLVDKVVMGDILKFKNLGKISAKAEKMVGHIRQAVAKKTGKQFIYHSVVYMSGIKFLANVLLMNGFLDLTSAPMDDTLCVRCGQENKVCRKQDLDCFRPARYILIHSDNSRAYNEQLMAKFNSRNNLRGEDVLILLGSKAVEEMYSFKAVRHLRIMSRPDNMSNLIQIIGRVNRKGSHKDLPENERNVEINIYTAHISGMLSYEEQKYKEKVADYKVIQQLERMLHEIAVDSPINRSIIGELPKKPHLGILDYRPDIRVEPKKLMLSTFRAFYQTEEVDQIIYVMKRAFIQYSPVWKYEHLLKFVQRPPFRAVLTTNMMIIDENSFVVALKKLLWDPKKSMITGKNIRLEDSVRDSESKVIVTETGRAVIMASGEYFKMVPFDHVPVLSEDTHYRIFHPESAFVHNKPKYLSISEFLKTQQDDPEIYYQQKLKFFEQFQEVKIDKMEIALREYQYNFHLKFIEETVEYVFRILTHAAEKRSEFHEFYFKMLYYYAILDLIVFANTATVEILFAYKQFLSGKIKKITKNEVIDTEEVEEIEEPITDDEMRLMSDNSMLESLKNSRGSSEEFSLKIESAVAYSNSKSLSSRKETAMSAKTEYGQDKTIIVKPSLLPIGHFLDKNPRFYHPSKGWYDVVNYHEEKKWAENNIIIGFFDKIPNSTKLLFKLRAPKKKSEPVKGDLRLIEKGSVCTTKSKTFLLDLMKKFKLDMDKKSTTKLCDSIRNELLRREYEERKNKTRVKWFYYHWE